MYDDGTPAAPEYHDTLWPGEWYEKDSPVIPGYETFREVVSGWMPNQDWRETVIYYKKNSSRKYINLDDYETALGLGMIQMHVGVCYE